MASKRSTLSLHEVSNQYCEEAQYVSILFLLLRLEEKLGCRPRGGDPNVLDGVAPNHIHLTRPNTCANMSFDPVWDNNDPKVAVSKLSLPRLFKITQLKIKQFKSSIIIEFMYRKLNNLIISIN